MDARAFLLIVAERLAPDVRALSPERRERLLATVADALATRPPGLARLFKLFLVFVRWVPVLRFGRRFDRLPPARQDAVLRWLEDAPLLALRSGFFGLKTLLFMGHYGQPELWPTIGYAPTRTGNDRLHA